MPEQARQRWQARATKVSQENKELEARVQRRRRLDRWQIATLPGHRVELWLRTLHNISSLIPPRVAASQLRVAFNGWVTSRRFQRSGCCVLGCASGTDSIEHYARCPRLRQCFRSHLRQSPPAPGYELDELLCMGLHNSFLQSAAPASAFRAKAVACYAAYRSYNGLRCGSISQELWEGSFLTYVREGFHGVMDLGEM